ncbi:hypothetical protein J3458_019503 [Metarhizium acridum]|uniref:uncharacterized protein n=1 Tax=Metarhizium acridum TaxID=92637 RepID=UPI001C6CC0C6|nr:hypothetical protein J3458_019503 [Metarhizium acridum]
MSQQECAVLTHPRKELLPQCQLLVLQEDIQFKEEASHSRTRGRPGCQQCQRLRLHFRFHLGMELYVSGSFSNFRNHSFFPSFAHMSSPVCLRAAYSPSSSLNQRHSSTLHSLGILLGSKVTSWLYFFVYLSHHTVPGKSHPLRTIETQTPSTLAFFRL